MTARGGDQVVAPAPGGDGSGPATGLRAFAGNGEGGESRAGPPARTGSPAGFALGVVIGVVLVASVVLRFMARSDLWLDEALSVNIARLPLGDIPDALRRDGAPPLYYVVLHLWIELFGDGDGAVRALSGLFSVATLPAYWFAGRRLAGRQGAWIALVVGATSPYLIRYGTEARMYALVMFCVMWGYLALLRALERPSPDRLALVAVVTAALLYLHNWSLYLVAAVGLVVLGVAWRGRDATTRRAAWRSAAAMAGGGVLYLPWVPVLLDQARHTGTPWADARKPWSAMMDVFDGMGGLTGPLHGESLVLRSVLTLLMALGLFAVGRDAWRIEVDLHTRPTVRWEALGAFGTLALGMTVSWLTGTTFVVRYAAGAIPILLLLVVAGILTFLGRVARVLVLTVVVVLGLAGGVRAYVDSRTQAGEVAAVIAAEARPGDVVLYCPDQIGTATSRLLRSVPGLVEVTFPDLASPEFVNWVDYRDRIAAADPDAVAERVLERAGDATIWYVATYGYRSVEGKCEALEAALQTTRRGVRRSEPDLSIAYFEPMGLVQFPGS